MPDELTTVGNFQFLPEAQAAQMHLEAEGIRSFLSDAETVNMDWLLGNALGYIKLQVPAPQAEAALAVLERIPARSEQEKNVPEDAHSTVCLACGGRFPASQAACPACGWSYANEEGEDLAEEEAGDKADSEDEQAASPLDKLRSIKRPLLLLLLSPFLIGLVVLALALLVWVARLLFRKDNT